MGSKHGTWAIEIKRNSSAKTTKGFNFAIEDIEPDKAFVVYNGKERYPKSAKVEAISFKEILEELNRLQ